MSNLTTDISVKYELPQIECNLESLKSEVAELKEKYDNWIVFENDIPEAKKVKATLNKLEKAINRKRIDITNEIKAPIDEFADKLKLITADIKDISNKIDEQVKDFEEKEKEAKRKLILTNDLWQPYMVFNDKWLNKTYALEDIIKELETQETNYNNNCLLIETTCKGMQLESERYITLLESKKDINEIINLINHDYNVIISNIKQDNSIHETEKTVESAKITVEDTQDLTILTFKLEIKGTRTQLKALRNYIDELGLEYTKL
jgi:hypothetical protein